MSNDVIDMIVEYTKTGINIEASSNRAFIYAMLKYLIGFCVKDIGIQIHGKTNKFDINISWVRKKEIAKHWPL